MKPACCTSARFVAARTTQKPRYDWAESSPTSDATDRPCARCKRRKRTSSDESPPVRLMVACLAGMGLEKAAATRLDELRRH